MIVPDSNGSFGFTATLGSEETKTRSGLLDRLTQTLGGCTAERLKYGKNAITTGAGGGPGCNLYRAPNMAEAFIGRHGFSEAFPEWSARDKNPTECLVQAVHNLIAEHSQRALEALAKHQGALEHIATALIDKQVLARDALLRAATLVESTSG